MHGQLDQIHDFVVLNASGIVDRIVNRISFPSFENVAKKNINHNPVAGL